MNITRKARLWAILLAVAATAAQPSRAQETAEAPQDASDASGLLDAAELDQLTAPIALYPDALLGQVLVATTYPMDVMKADRFLLSSPDLSDTARADAVDEMGWADSVKSLAAGFPELIGRMAEHSDWTELMGNALVSQTDDVLDSIQRLRAEAKVNGYLEDNAAMTVAADPETSKISISSTDPNVVYVPQYTSQVYTQPAPATAYVVSNDDYWGDALTTGAIVFGTAMIVDEIFDDDWGNGWDNGYWHGNGGHNNIDWNGDLNIDNGINIGNGNIGNGNIGNRPIIGNGDTIVAGNRLENIDKSQIDMTKIDRSKIGNGDRDFSNIDGEGGRIGAVSEERLDRARDANFKPSDADRAAAREKIAGRQAAGKAPVTLPAATGKGDRAGALADKGPDLSTRKPSAPRAEGAAKAKAKPANVSRPAVSGKAPVKRKPAASSPAFKPSGGSRAKASSARGHAVRNGRR